MVTDRDLKEAFPPRRTPGCFMNFTTSWPNSSARENMSRKSRHASPTNHTCEHAAQIMLEHTHARASACEVDETRYRRWWGFIDPVECRSGLQHIYRHPPGRGGRSGPPGRPPRPHQGSGGYLLIAAGARPRRPGSKPGFLRMMRPRKATGMCNLRVKNVPPEAMGAAKG